MLYTNRMKLTILLMVGAGGFFGAISRYLITYIFSNVSIVGINTLTVNVLGSFVAGILLAMIGNLGDLKFFLIIGFLGSFTTFSTFSLDSLDFFVRKEYLYLFAYVISNIILSLVAVALGYYLSYKLLLSFFK